MTSDATASHVVTQLNLDSQDDSARIMSQLMACVDALKKKNLNQLGVLSNHVKKYLNADTGTKPLKADPDLVMDMLPEEIINNLHEAVKLMVASGFEEECCHTYSTSRGEFIEALLLQIEFNDSVPTKERWIKIYNIIFKFLFSNERTLCDHVFSGFSSSADLSFLKLCRECTVRLPKVADRTCAKWGWGSSMLLLKTIHDLFIPELKSLFPDQYSVSLKDGVIITCNILEGEIKGIFKELENLIVLDSRQEAVPGGLHPITNEVMYDLRHVYEARDILELVLKEHPMVAGREGMSSSLSVYLAWMMGMLDTHLEAKFNSYTDLALGCVFMVNNERFIEQKAREYGWRTILGDAWIHKHTAKVKQYIELYQQSSWDNVLALLKLENNESVTPDVAAESMKEQLKLFNMQFKEICRVQSAWFVLDEKLRIEIRKPLEEILWPAYGNFIRRFYNVLGKHADEYIEYSLYDIDALLNDLFRAKNWSISSQKKM